MDSDGRRGGLKRAMALLDQLEEDRRSAPPEFRLVLEPYVPRLLECILDYRGRRIAERVLEAHVVQIGLCYARELQRLLPAGSATAGPRWIRSA